MAGTILFFYGADTYRSQDKLRALRRRYIDASLGDTNLATLAGATLTFPELARRVQAWPFLAKTRLVIVRDLLLVGKKEVQSAVVDYLVKIPETTVVCFYESGAPDKRTALFKRLAKEKLAAQFELLEGLALQRWVVEAARARRLALAPAAQKFLISAVGGDLWRMSNELDKLAAFAISVNWPTKLSTSHLSSETWKVGGVELKLTESDVRELVHREDEADVFELITAVARKQTGLALESLERLLNQGEAELYVLSMIAYQFRTLIVAAEAYGAGSRSQFDLARAAGIAPFVAQKMLPIIRDLSLADLIDRFNLILTYDLAIKTGQLEPRQALELLIVELSSKSSTMTKYE